MALRDCPRAGEYDPIPAKLFSPKRELVNQAPRITGWILFSDNTHVRVMSGMTREANIQQRQEAAGIQIFRIRRHEVSERVTHEFGMVWRGHKYSITGVGYPNLAEIELYTTPTEEIYEAVP